MTVRVRHACSDLHNKGRQCESYGVRMACLEGLQVVGEVCEQAFLLVGLEGGLTPDGPVKASQPLLADIARLRQHMQSVPATCCWRGTCAD